MQKRGPPPQKKGQHLKSHPKSSKHCARPGRVSMASVSCAPDACNQDSTAWLREKQRQLDQRKAGLAARLEHEERLRKKRRHGRLALRITEDGPASPRPENVRSAGASLHKPNNVG